MYKQWNRFALCPSHLQGCQLTCISLVWPARNNFHRTLSLLSPAINIESHQHRHLWVREVTPECHIHTRRNLEYTFNNWFQDAPCVIFGVFIAVIRFRFWSDIMTFKAWSDLMTFKVLSDLMTFRFGSNLMTCKQTFIGWQAHSCICMVLVQCISQFLPPSKSICLWKMYHRFCLLKVQ